MQLYPDPFVFKNYLRPTIAFLAACIVAAAWLQNQTSPREDMPRTRVPIEERTTMPMTQPALSNWLKLNANQPSPDLQQLLEQLPGVATWISIAMPEEDRSPALTLALNPVVHPLPEHKQLAARLGLDTQATILLLNPSALEVLTPPCPNIQPELRPLCDIRKQQEIDEILAEWLGVKDERIHTVAIEMSIGLGTRGAILAERAFNGSVHAEDPLQQQASALIVRSWTVPKEQIVPELTAILTEDSPLAMTAALELGRLGAAEAAPSIMDLADRLEGSAEGIIAEYAHALATETVHPAFTEQLHQPGL